MTDVSFQVMFPIPVPVTGVTVLSKIVIFFEGKKKKGNLPELLISFYLNPDKHLDQAAVSSAGKCAGKTKKKSETVSETHLLLAGQPACENQASFHWQC